MAQNPVFTITMRDGRQMKGELYPETAPQSVGNFVALANSGFYDGLIFHRVIPGFMIQGGDPKGMGFGGPGYCIKGEFAANGVDNPVKHTYGVLSMARSMDPDSAGSQFFIMTSDSPHLDGQYAAFGKVLEGMDVAEDIVNTPRDGADGIGPGGHLWTRVSVRRDLTTRQQRGRGGAPSAHLYIRPERGRMIGKERKQHGKAENYGVCSRQIVYPDLLGPA